MNAIGWILRGTLGTTLVAVAFAATGVAADERGDSAMDIVRRAESTPLRRTDGTIVRRVEKDQDGHVTRLLLNELQLSANNIKELRNLVHLRSLVLYHTNFADSDLQHLSRCTRLEHLNLSGTGVTDAAIDRILELKKLNSLCLGNVRVSADALEKLKNGLQSRSQEVRIGYSRRTE